MTSFSRVLMFSAGLLLPLVVIAAPTVEMQTSMGRIVIELDSAKAPKTVQNFVQYANDGFYNGTIFHRVMDGFMIQGGGMMPDMSEKPTRDPIVNESNNGQKNQRGTISMARRPDPNSATAQFFINLVDNSQGLDYPMNGGGYAVFGKVTQGMDIVDKIAKVPTGNRNRHQNVPVTPVVIQSIKIISDKK